LCMLLSLCLFLLSVLVSFGIFRYLSSFLPQFTCKAVRTRSYSQETDWSRELPAR
jgi:hypothetical protein